MKKKQLLITVLLLALLIACNSETKKETVVDSADTVFTNGKVFTSNDAQPWAEAVAITDDEIVFVGSTKEAEAFIGESTETTNLDGKMLTPGFTDAHSHPIGGGLIMIGVDLQSDDTDEIFSKIRKHVADNPDLDIIQGYGVRFNPWNGNYPTAAMLDEIESERPVFLWTIDGHSAWVNTKALEMAGVNKDTPEPVPGYSFYLRDDAGNPTGWIVEMPALMGVLNALVEINPEYIGIGVANWMPRFAAAGLTSIQDLGMGGQPEDMGFSLFTQLEKEGKLPIRLQGVYYWNDPAIDPIPILLELRKKYNSELVKAVQLKVNMDGGDDKHNALYVDGYIDKPDIEVNPIIPYEVINDVVRRADSLGIDVACHCFGDLGVRKMLDAIELAIEANPPRDRRNSINHGTLIHPDDYKRFKELGVYYETTGAWSTNDPLMLEITTVRLGQERREIMYPTKAIHDAGGKVAFGSDWPVSGYISEYRPLYELQSGVTRQLPGREDVAPLGGDGARLPLDLALKMHTLGGASAMGIDDITGSIEVGKKADLVVIDKNLFDLAPEKIHTANVLATMLNGKYTYKSEQ